MASTGIPGTSRDGVLARMDEAWPPFRSAALALGARALERETAAGWTYKQMLAHVAAWHVLTTHRLRAYRDSGVAGPPDADVARAVFGELGLPAAEQDALLREWDTDRFNAAVAAATAGSAAHDVLSLLSRSYTRLREEAAAFTDEQAAADVREGRSFVEALLEANTWAHYAEHRDELVTGLPRTADELIALVEAGWTPLRDAVRRRGRSGLAADVGHGWSYKDLLAHIVGWLQDVPPRLRAIRDGTERPIGSREEIDAFNEQAVAQRRLVGPEALLDELDASYRLMRDAVAGLRDSEVQDRRIRALVSTRTYLHWQEHSSELGL